jgi:hypothetical protein
MRVNSLESSHEDISKAAGLNMGAKDWPIYFEILTTTKPGCAKTGSLFLNRGYIHTPGVSRSWFLARDAKYNRL